MKQRVSVAECWRRLASWLGVERPRVRCYSAQLQQSVLRLSLMYRTDRKDGLSRLKHVRTARSQQRRRATAELRSSAGHACTPPTDTTQRLFSSVYWRSACSSIDKRSRSVCYKKYSRDRYSSDRLTLTTRMELRMIAAAGKWQELCKATCMSSGTLQ